MQANVVKQEELYWQAVLTRSELEHQPFVYGVATTGIYCLPSCPSRRPKREHVQFFRLPELAESAGYRACKRCQPKSELTTDPQVELMRQICQYIAEHLAEPLTLEHLAQTFDMSHSHLQRSFTKIVGISPQAFQEAYRMQAIKTSLSQGEDIASALYDAGYGSSSRLYSKAHSQLGMTPKTYQQKGENVTIHYSISESPLGQLLVAATGKGLCSVRLGDDQQALKDELFTEFSSAEIAEDCSQLSDWVKLIVKHLGGKAPHLDLPLDVRATAFQKQVWQALQAIPYGETRSYADVAESLGRPSAVRAVASACAKNPVALVVPCHRVIRSDGSMGGYRWGLERKKRLLEQEHPK